MEPMILNQETGSVSWRDETGLTPQEVLRGEARWDFRPSLIKTREGWQVVDRDWKSDPGLQFRDAMRVWYERDERSIQTSVAALMSL